MQAQIHNNDSNEAIIKNLIELIGKGNSHASLEDAFNNISYSLLGERPENLPYSIWQLAEHIRIAQWDILEFSRNAKHICPKWPDEYWPKETSPKSEDAWKECVSNIKENRKSFIDLVKNSGDKLYKPFEHGDGQTLLKEALVLADHNAYHTAEIIVIRRLLNDWKNNSLTFIFYFSFLLLKSDNISLLKRFNHL